MSKTTKILAYTFLLASILQGAAALQTTKAWGNSTIHWSTTSTNGNIETMVVSWGDINEDGFDDIILGNYDFSRVYIFYGGKYRTIGKDYSLTDANATLYGGTGSGGAIQLGDLNDDSHLDLVFSCQGNGLNPPSTSYCWKNSTHSIQSSVFVIYNDKLVSMKNNKTYDFNNLTRCGGTTCFNIRYNSVSEPFGDTLLIGDVNKDNNNDLIVSASRGGIRVGYVWVFTNDSLPNGIYNDIDNRSFWKIYGWQQGPPNPNGDGIIAQAIGDMDDDGYDDLIISSGGCDYFAAFTDKGCVSVLWANDTRPKGQYYFWNIADFVMIGQNCDSFGSYSFVDDLNNDGKDDLVSVAGTDRHTCSGGTNIGRTYVYYNLGRQKGIYSPYRFANISIKSNTTLGQYSKSWATASAFSFDFNKDGWKDLFISNPYESWNFGLEFILGNGNGSIYMFSNISNLKGNYSTVDADLWIQGNGFYWFQGGVFGAFYGSGGSYQLEDRTFDWDGSGTHPDFVTQQVGKMYFWYGEKNCTTSWTAQYTNTSCYSNDTYYTIKYYVDEHNCGTVIDLPGDNGTATNHSCEYCTENWSAQYTNTSCFTNDTYYSTKSYTDLAGCNSTNELPGDNGTITDHFCDWCVESWIGHNTSSSCLLNDTFHKQLTYNDTANCNQTNNLPGDNGTIYWLPCNYCTENIQEYFTDWSDCISEEQQRTKYYLDLNYPSCCNTTTLPADCHINNGSYVNTTEIQACQEFFLSETSAVRRGEYLICYEDGTCITPEENQALLDELQPPKAPTFSLVNIPQASTTFFQKLKALLPNLGWNVQPAEPTTPTGGNATLMSLSPEALPPPKTASVLESLTNFIQSIFTSIKEVFA